MNSSSEDSEPNSVECEDSGNVKKNRRRRSANFTPDEKNLLLELVFKFKNIIESKQTDRVNGNQKEAAWQKITALFNAQCPQKIMRSADSLKKLYANTKKKVRQQAANDKFERIKTGGGKAKTKLDRPENDLALAIMNEKTVRGLKNKFDNDNVDQHEEEWSSCNGATLKRPVTLESPTSFIISDEVDWSSYNIDTLRKPLNAKLSAVTQQNKLNKTSIFDNIITSKSSTHTASDIVDLNLCNEETTSQKNTHDHLTDPPKKNYCISKTMVPQPSSSTASNDMDIESNHDSEIKFKSVEPRRPNVERTPKCQRKVATSWHARRRPQVQALHSTHLSKMYSTIAEFKVELTSLQLQREKIESSLRKRSLELDVAIKEEYLKKIRNADANELPLLHLT